MYVYGRKMLINALIWNMLAIISGVSGADPVLTPGPTVTVTENNPLNLTCVFTPGTESIRTYGVIEWHKDGSRFNNPWHFRNLRCLRFGSSPEGYTDSCTTSSESYTFTLTTPALTPADHGQTWQCRVVDDHDFHFQYLRLYSGITAVSVLVPISNVVLNSPSETTLQVLEYTEEDFVCETAAGRPEASIRWYRYTGTKSSGVEMAGDPPSTSEDSDGMITTTGKLRYRPPRTVNGWRIYCTANNTEDSVHTSPDKVLDVHYPPSVQAISDQSTITDSPLSVTCPVTPGNPTTSITWTRSIPGSWSQSGTTLTMSSVQKADDATYTCTASNTMIGFVPGIVTEAFNLNVMYGPSKPIIHYNYGGSITVPNPVRVILDHSLSVSCGGSISNPASTYSWSGPASSSNGSLTIQNIAKQDAGSYTCTATTIMERTFGPTATGTNSDMMALDVLFAPMVNQIPDQAIEENQGLSITCSVIPGNPATTSFRWTRDKNSSWSRTGQTLTLNPSRDDADRYTCTASNTMQPSQGDYVTGTHSKSFNVVVYSPSTTDSVSTTVAAVAGTLSVIGIVVAVGIIVRRQARDNPKSTEDMQMNHRDGHSNRGGRSGKQNNVYENKADERDGMPIDSSEHTDYEQLPQNRAGANNTYDTLQRDSSGTRSAIYENLKI